MSKSKADKHLEKAARYEAKAESASGSKAARYEAKADKYLAKAEKYLQKYDPKGDDCGCGSAPKPVVPERVELDYDGCGCSTVVKDLTTLVPPSTPSTSVCEGKAKLTDLEFVYSPSSLISNTQGGKASVSGTPDADGESFIVIASKLPGKSGTIRDRDIIDSLEVRDGESFTVSGVKSNGAFGANTYMIVYDSRAAFDAGAAPLQTVQVHTSCSKPLFIGDQFGSFTLKTAWNTAGTEFTGAFGEATFEILDGPDSDKFTIENGLLKFVEKQKFDAEGDNQFEVTVRITGPDGKVTETTITVNVTDPLEDAITVEKGAIFVKDFDIQVECGKDSGVSICEGKNKPVELSFVYEPSNDSNNLQSKSSVTGDADDDGSSFIVVSSKAWGSKGLSQRDILHSEAVEAGDTLTVTAGGGKFGANTYFLVFDSQAAYEAGQAPLQQVQIHTSCSQPLRIDDQFGSFTLSGARMQDGTVFGGAGDPTDVTYSILEGPDSHLFDIDPVTGVLSFREPFDPASVSKSQIAVTVRATSNQDPTCFKDEEICIVFEEDGEEPDDCPTYDKVFFAWDFDLYNLPSDGWAIFSDTVSDEAAAALGNPNPLRLEPGTKPTLENYFERLLELIENDPFYDPSQMQGIVAYEVRETNGVFELIEIARFESTLDFPVCESCDEDCDKAPWDDEEDDDELCWA